MKVEIEHDALQVRRLRVEDLGAMERHLLELAPSDRRLRFLYRPDDRAISAYVRGLDPSKVILIGAFDPSERLVGLAEAHPVGATRTVEVAMTIAADWRRCGLGARLVARSVTLAFAQGARCAQFNFASDNAAVVRLVRALGGRTGAALGQAEIGRTCDEVAPNARPMSKGGALLCRWRRNASGDLACNWQATAPSDRTRQVQTFEPRRGPSSAQSSGSSAAHRRPDEHQELPLEESIWTD
jgi:ribosomal protein S18 acetylase RimI-like enzyme